MIFHVSIALINYNKFDLRFYAIFKTYWLWRCKNENLSPSFLLLHCLPCRNSASESSWRALQPQQFLSGPRRSKANVGTLVPQRPKGDNKHGRLMPGHGWPCRHCGCRVMGGRRRGFGSAYVARVRLEERERVALGLVSNFERTYPQVTLRL